MTFDACGQNVSSREYRMKFVSSGHKGSFVEAHCVIVEMFPAMVANKLAIKQVAN